MSEYIVNPKSLIDIPHEVWEGELGKITKISQTVRIDTGMCFYTYRVYRDNESGNICHSKIIRKNKGTDDEELILDNVFKNIFLRGLDIDQILFDMVVDSPFLISAIPRGILWELDNHKVWKERPYLKFEVKGNQVHYEGVDE